jgi:hypothetical protein
MQTKTTASITVYTTAPPEEYSMSNLQLHFFFFFFGDLNPDAYNILKLSHVSRLQRRNQRKTKEALPSFPLCTALDLR